MVLEGLNVQILHQMLLLVADEYLKVEAQ